MKALVYTATNELVYRDEPDPIPGAGEVLIKVGRLGHLRMAPYESPCFLCAKHLVELGIP